MHALVFDELAELPEALEEGDHCGVDLAVREAEGDGEVAGGVELESVAAYGGGGGVRGGCGARVCSAGSRSAGAAFLLEADDGGGGPHGDELITCELEVQTFGQRGEQEACLAPSGV